MSDANPPIDSKKTIYGLPKPAEPPDIYDIALEVYAIHRGTALAENTLLNTDRVKEDTIASFLAQEARHYEYRHKATHAFLGAWDKFIALVTHPAGVDNE